MSKASFPFAYAVVWSITNGAIPAGEVRTSHECGGGKENIDPGAVGPEVSAREEVDSRQPQPTEHCDKPRDSKHGAGGRWGSAWT